MGRQVIWIVCSLLRCQNAHDIFGIFRDRLCAKKLYALRVSLKFPVLGSSRNKQLITMIIFLSISTLCSFDINLKTAMQKTNWFMCSFCIFQYFKLSWKFSKALKGKYETTRICRYVQYNLRNIDKLLEGK